MSEYDEDVEVRILSTYRSKKNNKCPFQYFQYNSDSNQILHLLQKMIIVFPTELGCKLFRSQNQTPIAPKVIF